MDATAQFCAGRLRLERPGWFCRCASAAISWNWWGTRNSTVGACCPAKAINHTDEELETLAGLVNQRTNGQIIGKKGIKDGRGYMEDKPGQVHPAGQMSQ